ncbi:ATP-grasp domain-containing protein [Cystobacter fuscus]|uniref:ATP-grasp domain-containing protein n=1 Tax=Cystobacter fuscus TaxID=43 RepID=UPI0037C04EDF
MTSSNPRPLILVLNSGNPGRLSHLRQLHELGERYRLLLVLDSRAPAGWQTRFLPEHLLCDLSDLERSVPSLVKAIDGHGKPAGIINLSEFCVPLQAELAEHYQLLGPSREAALIGRDKSRMRAFFQKIGLPVPRFHRLSRSNLGALRELRLPIVLKPAFGGGSTLVQRCETYEEAEREFARMELDARKTYSGDSLLAGADKAGSNEFPFVAEELIGGEVLFPTRLPYRVGEISVESVHFGGQTRVLAIHDKPLPSNGPYFEEFVSSTPSRIPSALQEQARDYVDRIHRGLGGGSYVLHTEFRTLADGLMPLEFGIRMGGAQIYQTVRLSTGIDFLELLISISMGQTPEVQPGPTRPTIAHALWAPKTGELTRVRGYTHLDTTPYYVEHQFYDELGTRVKRAPLSSRAQGHVIYRAPPGESTAQQAFDRIEEELLRALDELEFEVDGERSTPISRNRV